MILDCFQVINGDAYSGGDGKWNDGEDEGEREGGGGGEPTAIIEMISSTPNTGVENPESYSLPKEKPADDGATDAVCDVDLQIADSGGGESGEGGEEDLVFDRNCCTEWVERTQRTVVNFLSPLMPHIVKLTKWFCLVAYTGYFLYCLCRPGGFGDTGSVVFLVVTLVAYAIIVFKCVPARVWPSQPLLSACTASYGSARCQQIRSWTRW